MGTLWLVYADQSGYIAGALIGQIPLTFQTSTEARLAPGSIVQVFYSLSVQRFNCAKQSLCNDENALHSGWSTQFYQVLCISASVHLSPLLF